MLYMQWWPRKNLVLRLVRIVGHRDAIPQALQLCQLPH